MYIRLLQMFSIGVGVLIAAIILNLIAPKLKLLTWYTFLEDPSQATFLSYLWLFIIYPFCLGAVAYAVNYFLSN